MSNNMGEDSDNENINQNADNGEIYPVSKSMF
jgi:hypothetical protein